MVKYMILSQRNNFISILLFVGLFYLSSFSQNPNEFVSELQSMYPDETAVKLDRNLHYIFELKDEKIEIYRIESEKIIFLKNPSGMTPSQSLFTSTFSELIDYEANSYIPDGKKYKRVSANDYKEKANVNGGSFYDDVKELSFTFHGVGEGTIIELKSKYQIHDPCLIPAVYLSSGMPVHNMEITLECDAAIDYDLIMLNGAGDYCRFKQSVKKNKNIRSCNIQHIDKIINEDNEPGFSYFEPHFMIKINSFVYNQKETFVLKDLHNLNKWYYSLVSDLINAEVDPAVKAMADSITKQTNSKFEEVRSLYYWIQSNIKYIDFEYGIGGFKPREAAVTLKNRYGDCKDKSMLLYALLKARGITSWLTWVGSNDLPYTYHEVPTPNADNHMILTCEFGDSLYFLDGTNRYHNFYLPSSFIQGKEALICMSADSFRIEKIPVQPPTVSCFTDSVKLQIEGASVTGTGILKRTGYFKTNLYLSLNHRNEKEKKRLLENRIMKGSNKFVLDEYLLGEYENYEKEVTMTYKFVLNDYVQYINDKIFINLNLNKRWLGLKIKDNRKHPVFLGYNAYTSNQFSLLIPENYKLDYMPEELIYEGEHFYMHLKYSIKNNTIHYDQVTWYDVILVEPDLFPEYKAFINAIEQSYKQTILLIKNE
ncbi:MAG: DUF3857 domain-containing protein [Bacteroidales bacterium]|nr:DUF3857 domain-containing protein [Bacteroidales bacterium]